MRLTNQKKSLKQSAVGKIPSIANRLVLFVALILLNVFPAHAGERSARTEKVVAPDSAQMVIIGASYAKGWNPGKLGGHKIINRGIGGEQTHEVLARFDRDVAVPAVRTVIIWGFINDIFRSTPEEVKPKLVRSQENINAMIEKARQKGITPILATEVTLPMGDSWSDRVVGWIGALRGKQSYQDYVNGHVVEMNKWLRQLATDKQLMLLDFEKVLADSKNNRRKLEYATPDGTHLSPQAYDALTEYAQRKIVAP